MSKAMPCVIVVLTAALAANSASGEEKPILVLDAGRHTATVTMVIFSTDGKELIDDSNDKASRV